SPATTTKHGTTRSPTSTNTSLRDVARRRPCEVIRASCAGVSFGNKRSGRETVAAKGVCVVTGSGVSMGEQRETRGAQRYAHPSDAFSQPCVSETRDVAGFAYD